MVEFTQKARYTCDDLRTIVHLLRGPGGCPWDGEQTHASIRRDFLEEVYEAVEAIDQNSTEHLREELGDVLLQVVFHADIEADAGRFNFDDVADEVCKKLIYRHPHVFGQVQVDGTDQVLANWETLKRAEKGQRTSADAVDAVSRTLPALWRAEKVQKKAAKAGFDFPDISGPAEKLTEEAGEVRRALAGDGDPAEELGDLLFAGVKVARFLGLDPEACLHAATDKFAARFRRVEELAARAGRPLSEMTLPELESLWARAKEPRDKD